jgi:hypothetical protein
MRVLALFAVPLADRSMRRWERQMVVCHSLRRKGVYCLSWAMERMIVREKGGESETGESKGGESEREE